MVLLVTILLPGLLYLILLLPAVQTQLVHILTNRLSEDFDTEISIGYVHLMPFKRLSLGEVLIMDQKADTLLFVPKFTATIDSLGFKKRQIYLRTVNLEEPHININQTDTTYNFSFLFDALAGSTDSTTTKWKYLAHSVTANQAQLSFTKYDTLSKTDKSIFFVKHLNTAIADISNNNNKFSSKIEHLSFVDKSGFAIKEFSSQVTLTDSCVLIKELTAHSQHSLLALDSLYLNTRDITDFNSFARKGNFHLKMKELKVSPKDFSYFPFRVPFLNSAINLSGSIYGTISNLKGRNINLSYGQHSKLSASFDLNGLPNMSETYIFLDVKELNTSAVDLERLIAISEERALELPTSFNRLGTIRYKGNFTGFLSDLVAYGTFSTNLGMLRTDIGLKLDASKKLVFSGKVRTRQFNLGQLLNAEKHMGTVTMEASMTGSRSSASKFFAFIEGTVDSIIVKDYKYQNIKLSGLFANQRFDGKVNLQDPNGSLNFQGKIDYSGDIPDFNFQASLKDIKLDKLNLLTTIPDNNFSVNMSTNIIGNDIDDVIGNIKISNIAFTSPEKSLAIDSIYLKAYRKGENKHLVLHSDIAEGELIGKYNFKRFYKTLQQQLRVFLPAVIKESNNKLPVGKNDFSFTCKFKGIHELVSLALPGINISDDGLIVGRFNDSYHLFNAEGELGYFHYKNIHANDFSFYIGTQENKELSCTYRIKDLNIKNLFSFQNLSLHQKAVADTLQFNLFWNNWDEYTNSGAIYTTTTFKRKEEGLFATINLNPSSVIVKDSIWHLEPSVGYYHPQGFSINNLRVWHKNQAVGFNGFQHKSTSDKLSIYVQNLNLHDILKNLELKGISISGILNGDFELRGLYRTPILTTKLDIDEFEINKDHLGDFTLKSSYNAEQRAINLVNTIKNNNRYPLNGGGRYYVDSKTLNLNYQVDSLPISFLNLYLKKVMQNLSGTASGNIGVTGPLNEIGLSGRLKVNQATFDVGLLKTSYSVTDSVIFHPHKIEFKDLIVSDLNNNTARFFGAINHTGFRGMTYDLHLEGENIQVLNTKEQDNPLYYGTVYADGNMAITGSTQDIIIDIAAKTRDNSTFFLPLKDEEEAEETNFIRFTSHEEEATEHQKKDNQYKIDLSGMDITMDLDVNPAAKIQVIFDSKIGDILKGTGNGNMQIRIDKQGRITFYGDYTIEEGDYMFTLRNVLNKRFVINKGSMVKWDGDPYDALIDLNATYKLKASLYELMAPTLSGDNNSDYYRRIPINCNLLLSDRLLKPIIKFDIETPSLQQGSQDIIDGYITSEEELNRQVISLLVLNKFYAPENLRAGESSSGKVSNQAALVTTTEVLSNQLSHWLSQISNDIDIGVAYRPGDEISNEEVEVALSTQMFNNRVTINGNVGYGKYQAETSKLIGDFDLDVKLNNTGTIRAKAYTHSNNDIIYETSPTTQGVGLSFKEEFNTFGELLRKYWGILTGKKEEDRSKRGKKDDKKK
ncbi:translocation/assembly module TamB [Marinilabiliaceae bacterium JC017]|nr:translocation/assembly module TamB [Marinilabiliaceae bacterium JC017]